MIDTYKRLHRQEQEARVAAGLEPSRMGPMMGLAIGIGATIGGLAVITGVLAVIGWVMS
ncbi:MAG: hypothetical protein K2Q27_00315 [Novosphingobium sp.]|uniref:hypothetical protein n=1 Tax=Novosphingobium sp. NDB2Meth1 TaxID=1892847 RepID=UPI000ADFCA22|nr:hypothetical protein [Novosphingobium sp. NDB2Meth1]MBY0391686.1 hypothetical protein [Novosphingobium sp.]